MPGNLLKTVRSHSVCIHFTARLLIYISTAMYTSLVRQQHSLNNCPLRTIDGDSTAFSIQTSPEMADERRRELAGGELPVPVPPPPPDRCDAVTAELASENVPAVAPCEE